VPLTLHDDHSSFHTFRNSLASSVHPPLLIVIPSFNTTINDSPFMQSVVQEIRLQDVRTRLLEEIKATKKRIHPEDHPLSNLTMQNKIDHANRILRLMDRYPNMTVEELFYLIACRIEGEKFVVSSYRWSVPMLQETYDNRDNLERLQYLVWDAGGKLQWED
jgi:hypothetical protein